jgi:putative hydrolase of the HAD superfamily
MLEAVVFDWGGTLTDWALVDLADMWRLAARHINRVREQEIVERLGQVEKDCWERGGAQGTVRRLVRW